MRSRLFLLLLPAVLVLSCTIEKRLHRPGYHIEWKKRLHTVKGEENTISERSAAAIRMATAEAADTVTAAVVQETKAETPVFQQEKKAVRDNPHKIQPPIAVAEQLSKTVQSEEHKHIARAKPKAVVVILAAAWFIVAALLLIAGISLVSGSPVWGIILIVLSGIMLFLPLLGIGGGRSKKKSTAGFAPFAPEPRFRKVRLRPDKDVQQKAIIVFILVVLYILLAILGVIFGISLISAGTMAVGILLLVLGGLMLLIPAAALILVATSGKKH